MHDRIDVKWRPPLLLVLGGVLGTVLAAPLAGLFALRFLGPSLGFRSSALLIAALVLLLTLILGYLLWRLLLRPVTALADRAAQVKAGQPMALDPLPHYGTQELQGLGQAVLDMAATLQNREATIRSFTDHATHELKTPISAIRGAAEILDVDAGLAAQDRRLVASILASAHQMEAQLLALRRVAAAREPTHHGQCTLAALAPMLRADFAGLTQTITGGGVLLPLSPQGMDIVLRQMLGNAQAHGATAVSLQASDGRRPALTISDNGAGISDGNRAQVFTPFFTTRRNSGGTGMGLTIVRSLLQAHGAAITLLPTDSGSAFRIDF